MYEKLKDWELEDWFPRVGWDEEKCIEFLEQLFLSLDIKGEIDLIPKWPDLFKHFKNKNSFIAGQKFGTLIGMYTSCCVIGSVNPDTFFNALGTWSNYNIGNISNWYSSKLEK